MVNTFCRNQDADCFNLPEVQEIIQSYEDLLGTQCIVTGQEEEDVIIISLKALKTIGHLVRSHNVVEKCYLDYSNSMYIRLAALDTIREISCKSSYAFYQKLFSTFSDTALDSELRIGAYLSLMSCPTTTSVNLVKHVLISEPINQGL